MGKWRAGASTVMSLLGVANHRLGSCLVGLTSAVSGPVSQSTMNREGCCRCVCPWLQNLSESFSQSDPKPSHSGLVGSGRGRCNFVWT
eukprot:12952987-Alexandrium_andersonii.AAC.1